METLLLNVNLQIKIIQKEYFTYSKCTISNSAFVKHQSIVSNTRIRATEMVKYYLCENIILNNNFYHSFNGHYTFVCFAWLSFYAMSKQTVNLGNSRNASNRLKILGRTASGRDSRFRHYDLRKGRQRPVLGPTSKLNSSNYCFNQKFQLI